MGYEKYIKNRIENINYGISCRKINDYQSTYTLYGLKNRIRHGTSYVRLTTIKMGILARYGKQFLFKNRVYGEQIIEDES